MFLFLYRALIEGEHQQHLQSRERVLGIVHYFQISHAFGCEICVTIHLTVNVHVSNVSIGDILLVAIYFLTQLH